MPCDDCDLEERLAAREEYPGLPPCPSMPILTRNGFKVVNRVFESCDFDLEDEDTLRSMMDPYQYSCKKTRRRWIARATIMTKDFLLAHLTYYNIGPEYKIMYRYRKQKLRKLLREGLENGQCAEAPADKSELETTMMADYERMFTEWEQEVAGWEAQKAELEKEARWAAAENAQERANVDPYKMVRHHFCRGRKSFKARPSRTPHPIVLANFSGDVAVLLAAVRKVRGRGLHHAQAAHYAGSVEKWVHAIGWKATDVRRLAESTARDIQQAFHAEEWEQVKEQEGHNRLVTVNRLVNQQPNNRDHGRRPKIDDVRGHFAMLMPRIRDRWAQFNVLRLHVSRAEGPVAVASCDFGFIKGTMLLATNADSLTEYIRNGPGQRGAAASSPAGRRGTPLSVHKRRRLSSQAELEHLLSRRATEYPLYFLFRGRNTRDNSIQAEVLEGKIFFSGEDLNTFRGTIDFGQPLETVTFQGFRLEGFATESAPKWEAFSREAAEREERAGAG